MATDKLDSTQILPRVYVEDDTEQGIGHLKTSITDGQDSLEINPDGSINVVVLPDTPVFLEQEESFTAPVGPQQAFIYTPLNGVAVTALYLTANTGEAIWYIRLNGDLIRMGRASPTLRTVTIDFKQPRLLEIGDELTVDFEIKAENQRNPFQYQTFTAFEGFNT